MLIVALHTRLEGEKLRNRIFTLFLMVVLFSSSAFVGNVVAVNGPKADQLLIKIYPSDVAEYGAFEAGAVEVFDMPLSPAKVKLYSRAPYNESVVLSFYAELDVFQFDINNNATIPSYSGIIQPTSDPWFRVALQYLVDKDYIVGVMLEGLGVRIDTPMSPAQGYWVNPNVQHYGYNPTTAEAILDAHGYTMGTTWRINPDTGVDMDPLIFAIRADDTLRRTPAGLYFAAELEAVGIPVDERVVDRSICYEKVMVENNYNLYTGGLNLGRDPDYLYSNYHSSMYWGPWSSNYNHVNDSLLDWYLSNGYFHAAQARLMNRPDDPDPGIAVIIPLWSTRSYTAYLNPLVGVVNVAGSGTTNWWTFLAAHLNTSDTGGTIRWGFQNDVVDLNPLYSSRPWDGWVLNEVYDTLLHVNPYSLNMEVPWIASSWETTTWAGGTLLAFTLNDGITWHDGQPLTVEDVKFTLDYIKNFSDAWLYSNVADIDHVDIDLVQRKVYIYENVFSVRALDWVSNVAIIPKHIWKTITDPHGLMPDPTLTGSGVYRFIERVAGDHITLAANRDHFMPTHPTSDVNLDMTTDIFDIITVAASFGKRRGQEGFNIIADVAAEWDIIDIFDLIVVASAFGTSWTP